MVNTFFLEYGVILTSLMNKVLFTFENGRIYEVKKGILSITNHSAGIIVIGRPNPDEKISKWSVLLPDDVSHDRWVKECEIMGKICEIYKIDYPKSPTPIAIQSTG
ncbi:hypothetical protein V4849_09435 [Kluyvera ascorbata]